MIKREKKMREKKTKSLAMLFALLLLMLPIRTYAAITVADVVSEIPSDISIQAGGSTTDLSKDIITLSFSVTTNLTNVKLTGITINDSGTITPTDAGVRVFINTKGKYTTRGAVLAVTKNYGTWTKGTAITFDRQVSLTQNVKAYVFVIYDLTNTAAGKTTKTSVTAMTVSGDTWSGSATTANTTSIISKTACVDNIQVSDCGKCHNYNGYYQVYYPYSSPTTRGSHDKHVNGTRKFECWRCHNSANSYFARYTTKAPLHQNGTADIGPKIYDNSTTVGGTWSSAAKTCSTVDCHMGVTTPKWGTINNPCTACHAVPPATGAHSQHFTSLGITANQTNYCYYCHDGAGSGSSLHGDGTVDVVIASSLTNSLFNDINVVASYTPSGSANGTCSNVSCHGGITTYNWTSGTGTSYNPADSKYKILIASGTISGRTVPASETRAAGWLKCTACHVVDNITAGNENQITRWNSARSGKHYLHAVGSAADSAMKSYTGQVSGVNYDRKRIRVAKCYVCHNDAHYDNAAGDYRFKVVAGQYNVTTSNFDANTGGTAAPNNMGGAINGNTIYTYTDSSNTAQSQTISGTAYTQQVYYKDGANSYTSGTCSTNCHGGGTWSYTASLDCTTCHAQTQKGGTIAPVVSEFSMSSHHVQGVAVNAQHCYKCHWEADNNAGTIVKNTTYHGDGRSDLVIFDIANNARPTTSNTNTRTVFKRYSLIASLTANRHCLSCHNASGKVNQPFGDGKTPNQYSWDGSSVAERYVSFTTYSSHKYNPATYNVVPQKRKTSSSHYAMNIHKRGVMVGQAWQDDQTAFIATNTYTSTNAGSVACLDCHNSHGSNLTFGQFGFSSYSSATGKYKGAILKQTWSGLHGYNVNYTPTEAYYVNNLGGANSRRSAIWSAQAALCFDCHLGEDTKPGGVGAATTSMPRNYMQYGRAKGNVIAGYYDALDYEAARAANNRALLHGQGRWYIDNSNAGYSNTTNANSPAFWQGEFTYKKGTIIGSHFQKHPGNYVTGYTPRNWRDSANSGNTNSNFLGGGMGLRGMCTYCHDPHGVNVAKDPANIAYYSPQLKGRWLTAPYYEDRPGNRETGTNTTGNYARLQSFTYLNNLTNSRVAPRMLPSKTLNRPRQTGLGYGFGLDDTTVKGQDGFFIDDNTFGVTINNGTTAIDLYGNNLLTINSVAFWFSGWTNGNGAKTIRTGGNVTTNTITETDVQFAGLCLGCHPKNTLLNSRSSNDTRIPAFRTRAHRTVKGWMAAYSSVTTGRAADIVPNYYINRVAPQITQGFTGANNNANISMSPQYTYTTAGTTDFRGIGAQVGVGYHLHWGLWLGKQTDTNGANNVQVQYHNFPCSKCHTTHSARLPRLLKTNCLDIWQSKDVANNWAPANNIFRQKHSTNATNNWLQRMPFITANIPSTATTTNLANVLNWNPARATRCHNSPLVKNEQYQTRWNDVTPWQ